jgi:hypothetical protein
MSRPESQNVKSQKKRSAARLDCHLEKRLLAYVAAASAAGVGMLACPPQAQAKVVFTDTWIPIAPIGSVTYLDLNNDGIADFLISNKHNRCSASSSYQYCVTMKVIPQNASNAIWGTNNGQFHGSASALGSGVTIGSQGKFQSGHEFMGLAEHTSRNGTEYRSGGPWKETTRGFLGLKFVIQGQIHYGWARLSVSAGFDGMYGAISGYAYETEPNTPITTGQENGAPKKKTQKRVDGRASYGAPASALTGSLGMLAGGAPAIKNREEDTQPLNSHGAQ